MEIRQATIKDKAAWDSYVWNHSCGVAYHQFAWGQAVKSAYGFEPVYLIAEDQGEVAGVLPLIGLTIPVLGSQLVSLPYCDLGGFLAEDDTVAVALSDYAVNLAKNRNDKKLELRQSAESDEAGQVSKVSKVRMLLSLPDSSDELMKGFKAKLRSQVKKPMKDGLTTELGGTELMDEFYKIMAVNMRDLGSPVHSRRWFKAVVDRYGENVRVGIVRGPGRKAIAGGIILLHKSVVSIPWASTLREYNRLNPNMLLYWSFLSFAADNGFKTFDFGRSTPGEGTYRFKEQWGAQPEPLKWGDLLSQTCGYEETTGTPLRNHLETVWKKLPVVMSTIIGSRLRRYIDL